MGRWRRFELQQPRVGVVADGVQFADPLDLVFGDGMRLQLPAGWCRVVWSGPPVSTVLWPSVQSALSGGVARLVWLEKPAEL